MSNPLRPRSHADRDVCIRSLDDYLTAPDAKPGFVVEVRAVYTVSRDAYLASRRAYRQAKGVADQAADAVEDADDAFDRAWRRWARSVTSDDGKAMSRELAALLGGRTPGEIPQLPFADEVTLAEGLLTELPNRPDLSGDPEAVAELREATAGLAARTGAWEAARRAQRQAGVTLERDQDAFDLAYGKCRRVGRGLLDEAVRQRVFPVFHRGGSED